MKKPSLLICMIAGVVIFAAAIMPPHTPTLATNSDTTPDYVTETPETVIETPESVIEQAESATEPGDSVIRAPEAERDENDVEMLARLIWGEARGIPSTAEKAAVVWCVLNRVDDPRWPDTIAEVVKQENQFVGYSPSYPATEEHIAIAADVLARWKLEKIGLGDAGRVLPAEYTFFTGDGKNNHFRNTYSSGELWDWSLQNPYKD
ncbi:MAG: cell wall hydrolase [Christensenellaceae bacterium]|jgi:hypothetical protein|nr:cell wall hydrolase [Christensenellaceae bacterium]